MCRLHLVVTSNGANVLSFDTVLNFVVTCYFVVVDENVLCQVAQFS